MNVGTLTAELRANVRNFERALDQAEKRSRDFARSLAAVSDSYKADTTEDRLRKVAEGFGKVTGLATAAAGALGFFGAHAIKLASDLNETMSAAEQAFGPGSMQQIESWADTTGAAVGRSSKQMAEFATSMQSMLGPMVGSEKKAASMSLALSKLAVDLGSFHNTADADAANALRSGLAGETEALRRYGVTMTETALKEFAREKGLGKLVNRLTEADKVSLRYAFILSHTSTAQGDATRTADSFSNQLKRASGQVENLGTKLGAALLPMFAPLLQMVNGVLAAFDSLDASTMKVVAGAGVLAAGTAAAVAAFTGFLVLLPSLIAGFQALKVAWVALGPVLTGSLWPVLGIIGAVGLAVFAVIQVVGMLRRAWKENWGGMRDFLLAFWESAKQFFQAIGDVGKQAFDYLAEQAGGAFDWILDKLLSFRDAYFDVLQAIADRATKLGEGMQEFGVPGGDSVAAGGRALSSAIAGARGPADHEAAKKELKKFVADGVLTLKDFSADASVVWSGIGEDLSENLKAALGDLYPKLKGFMEGKAGEGFDPKKAGKEIADEIKKALANVQGGKDEKAEAARKKAIKESAHYERKQQQELAEEAKKAWESRGPMPTLGKDPMTGRASFAETLKNIEAFDKMQPPELVKKQIAEQAGLGGGKGTGADVDKGFAFNLPESTRGGPGQKPKLSAYARAVALWEGYMASTIIGTAQRLGQSMLQTGGAFGSIMSAALEGFANGGVFGAVTEGILAALQQSQQFQEVMQMLNGVFQTVADVVGMLIGALQPVLAPILEVVSLVVTALQPAFDVLAMVLEPFGAVLYLLVPLFQGIAPIIELVGKLLMLLNPALLLLLAGFKVLFPIIQKVAEFILAVVEILASVWNGIVGVVQKVVFSLADLVSYISDDAANAVRRFAYGLNALKIDVSRVSNAQEDLAGLTEEEAKARNRQLIETQKLGKSAQQAAEALSNVPEGYKVAMARFEAMAGKEQPGVAAVGTAGSAVQQAMGAYKPMASGHIVRRPTRALIGEAGPEAVVPLSRNVTGLGSGGGNVTVNVTIVSNDARAIWEQLKALMEQENIKVRGSFTPVSNPFVHPLAGG